MPSGFLISTLITLVLHLLWKKFNEYWYFKNSIRFRNTHNILYNCVNIVILNIINNKCLINYFNTGLVGKNDFVGLKTRSGKKSV